MTDLRYVIVIPFDTKEQRDDYYEKARESFYNNIAKVDAIAMSGRMRKGIFKWVSPFTLSYWKNMFPKFREVTERED